MPLVVDRDVFPVDVGNLEPELADDPAILSDREEQGGIPRVVMNPIDARIPAALDDARRLRNRCGSNRPSGSSGGINPKANQATITLANTFDIGCG